jgi:hypothetical protein
MGRHRARPDRIYRSVRSVPGEYRDRKESRVPDESWRYIVAVARPRVRELRRLLERAANTFDQESIYFSIKGDVEFVKPTDDLGLE